MTPVVCINAFYTDTDREIEVVRRLAEETGQGSPFPGTGSLVGEEPSSWLMLLLKLAKKRRNLRFFMNLRLLRQRIEMIAKEVCGADGVEYSPEAMKKPRMEARPEIQQMGTCMVKTHLSLSDNQI